MDFVDDDMLQQNQSPSRSRQITTHSNLVESSALTSITRTTLQHTQGDTIRYIGQTSVPGDITLQPNGITDKRVVGSDSVGRITQFSRHALGKRDRGDATWLCAVYPARAALRQIVFHDERRDLG